jgi:hypothetical protein
MKSSLLFKSLPWRPVAGLVLAGLLGWVAAWLTLSSGGAPGGSASGPAATSSSKPKTADQALSGSAGTASPETSSMGKTLDQLLKRQDQVSEGASRSIDAQPQAANPAAPGAVPNKATTPDAKDAARLARMNAMRELQARALADIQAVPPGDNKKLMAAMERFDAQMRAAGAPSIIDMDNLRKTLDATDRLQLLNRQLVAEAEKGKNADPIKVKALSQEIQATQLAMPRQFIKTNVLTKQLAQ